MSFFWSAVGYVSVGIIISILCDLKTANKHAELPARILASAIFISFWPFITLAVIPVAIADFFKES